MSITYTLVALISFALILLSFQNVEAVTGVDLSQPCSAGGFQCLRNNGHSFAVIRCYMSVGRVDPNCVNTVRAAKAAGMPHVDVYIFPCPRCGNGRQQVIDTVNTLRAAGASMLWLDIEGTQYWLGDIGRNRAFFEELLAGVAATGQHTGVYTSKSQWGPIMGLDYTRAAGYDLWYAHYDGKASFYDFSPFGGWNKPAIKQYAGDVALCGCGVDLNYYP